MSFFGSKTFQGSLFCFTFVPFTCPVDSRGHKLAWFKVKKTFLASPCDYSQKRRKIKKHSSCSRISGLILVLFILCYVFICSSSPAFASFTHYVEINLTAPLCTRLCHKLPTVSCGTCYGYGVLFGLQHTWEDYVEVRYRYPQPSGPFTVLKTYQISEIELHPCYSAPCRTSVIYSVPYMKSGYACGGLTNNSCAIHSACMPCCCGFSGQTDYSTCEALSYPLVSPPDVLYHCWNVLPYGDNSIYEDVDCDGVSVAQGDCNEDCYNHHACACSTPGSEICGNGCDEDCSGSDLVCPPAFTPAYGISPDAGVRQNIFKKRFGGFKNRVYGGYEKTN